jgi:hypothetical protein
MIIDWFLKKVWDFLRPKLVNFRTTIMGVGMILVGLSMGWKELEALVAGEVPDKEILGLAAGQLIGGWGLIAARDAEKTTLESVGEKRLEERGYQVHKRGSAK